MEEAGSIPTEAARARAHARAAVVSESRTAELEQESNPELRDSFYRLDPDELGVLLSQLQMIYSTSQKKGNRWDQFSVRWGRRAKTNKQTSKQTNKQTKRAPTHHPLHAEHAHS